ncbi:uncharacterized protein [Hemitrygon akajei]|uniref:uncharacterized protein n=1 Tax=Hemitrygon akajei TaxID=2704970 RepID=UPI003BF998E5
MDEGGNPAGKAPKRLLPGGSSREDDRDTGSKVPKQGQIASNVPMECSPAAAEVEQSRPRDRDVGDTDQDPGTSTSEATVYQLGSSLNMELSTPQQGAEPKFTISELLAPGEEYRLCQLTKFYRDRLQQAIEEKVERLGSMLTKEGYFSREENEGQRPSRKQARKGHPSHRSLVWPFTATELPTDVLDPTRLLDPGRDVERVDLDRCNVLLT